MCFNPFMHLSLLRTPKSLRQAKQLHAIVIRHGGQNLGLTPWNDLLHFYARNGHFIYAHHLFDRIPERLNVVSWTTLISAHAQHGHSEQAMFLASRMQVAGIIPNNYTIVSLLQASANLCWIDYGHQSHSFALRFGFHSNLFVATSLVNFYAKCGLVNCAHHVFVEIPEPNLVSWNSLISGYVQNGQSRMAFNLVVELVRSNLRPDQFTFAAGLSACTQLCSWELGKTIHCQIVKLGFGFSVVVGNSLIDMYGKCGIVEDAILCFHEMINKDVVSWNSVIGASSRNQRIGDALDLLCQMSIPDTLSWNEVIAGIAQFGDMEDALKLLFEMPNPNPSSWNSIIAGYLKQNRAREALHFFILMNSRDIVKDEITFCSILKGVASLSTLKWGALIHCCTVKYGLDSYVVVGSALIDMYAKCGCMNEAQSVFGLLPKKNLITWNAMIGGYAHNGKGREIFQLFEQLKKVEGLKPDHITFVGILSSCARDRGLFDAATKYFESMIRDYGINPTAEHVSCMISLLGQEGELLRAERMIHELGFESCGLVWRALLSACRYNQNANVAEIAAARVLELEGDDEFVYVQLSNVYADIGRWTDVNDVRGLMRERGLRKEAGCSWIEVEKVVPF